MMHVDPRKDVVEDRSRLEEGRTHLRWTRERALREPPALLPIVTTWIFGPFSRLQYAANPRYILLRLSEYCLAFWSGMDVTERHSEVMDREEAHGVLEKMRKGKARKSKLAISVDGRGSAIDSVRLARGFPVGGRKGRRECRTERKHEREQRRTNHRLYTRRISQTSDQDYGRSSSST